MLQTTSFSLVIVLMNAHHGLLGEMFACIVRAYNLANKLSGNAAV